MKVKILKAWEPQKTCWYADKIGEVFEVVDIVKSYVVADTYQGAWKHIYKDDCELVKE